MHLAHSFRQIYEFFNAIQRADLRDLLKSYTLNSLGLLCVLLSSQQSLAAIVTCEEIFGLTSDVEVGLGSNKLWQSSHVQKELDPLESPILKKGQLIQPAIEWLELLSQAEFPKQSLYRAPELAEVLIQFPELKPRLERVLAHLLHKIRGHDDESSLGPHYSLLQVFLKSDLFANRANEIMKQVFYKLESPSARKPRTEHFVDINFKFVSDTTFRKKIIQNFMDRFLATGDFNVLENFVAHNKGESFPEFSSLAISLATEEDLDVFSKATKGLNYKSWGAMRWVKNSYAISIFKETFYKVAGQSPRIYFEVGRLFNDTYRLRSSLMEIHNKGDNKVLQEISTRYANGAGRFNQGDHVSITNLELYWVLINPEFYAKVLFYFNGKLLSESERDQLMEKLKNSY